jgi:drug/metabolite transporter (DMT)-like permease
MAVVGIGVLSIGSIAGGPEPRYLAAAIFGTLAVAASSVVVKSLFHVHPLNLNAVGMVAGTALLATGSLLLGERWQLPREPRTWAAVGWLVVLGSLGLFQLFLYVMRRWTASATVYAIAAMPLVAVALGAVLLGQPVTRGLFIGGTLVIGAVYIGAAAGARRG